MPAEDSSFVQVPRSANGPGQAPLAHSQKWGIQRSNLTLWLSMAALIVSLSSAGVTLFVFLRVGLRQMEADVALKEADVALKQEETRKERSLADAAVLQKELIQQQIDMIQQQTNTSAAQEAKAKDESTLVRTQTRTAMVDRRIAEEVVQPAIPDLSRSVGAATSGSGAEILRPPGPTILGAPSRTLEGAGQGHVDALGPKDGNIK